MKTKDMPWDVGLERIYLFIRLVSKIIGFIMIGGGLFFFVFTENRTRKKAFWYIVGGCVVLCASWIVDMLRVSP